MALAILVRSARVALHRTQPKLFHSRPSCGIFGTAGSHLGSAFAIERWQYERANAIETREGQWDFERRRPSDSACMGDGLMYNVVIRGARSSHSVDVENDSVRIAAVVAMPDDMCGDVSCGFVELRKGCHAAEAEVIDHGK